MLSQDIFVKSVDLTYSQPASTSLFEKFACHIFKMFFCDFFSFPFLISHLACLVYLGTILPGIQVKKAEAYSTLDLKQHYVTIDHPLMSNYFWDHLQFNSDRIRSCEGQINRPDIPNAQAMCYGVLCFGSKHPVKMYGNLHSTTCQLHHRKSPVSLSASFY